MPFARDSFTTLRQNARADIAARLPGSDPFVRRSPLGVLADVIAKFHDLQMGYLDWQSHQAVPFTARGEYLEGWAALRNVSRAAAVQATGTVAIAGALPGRSIVAGGPQLVRSDGAIFAVTAGAVTAGNGSATISVIAIEAGAKGDCDAGTVLTWATPIDGVPPTTTVVAIAGGADIESDDDLLLRSNQAWANPPQGGDLDDYVKWVFDSVPSVTRCWAGGPAIMGPGTVVVYFMIDDLSHANGLPSGTNGVSQYEPRDSAAVGDQLVVADALFPLRPATALVYATAPTGVALNLTLGEVPVDATIRAGISDALAGLCLRKASPAGVSVIRRLASGLLAIQSGGTIYKSEIEAAIAAVPNLDHFVLTSPAADVVLATNGQISIPGTITYS